MTTPNTPIQELHALVVDASIPLPVAKRARIYRALGEIIGDELKARELHLLAQELEVIERRTRQLLLSLN